MKSFDLEPNIENLCQAYKSDFLDRNKDIDAFINLLHQVEGPFSIALDSEWGSGKTFFVKQTKMLLDGELSSSVPRNLMQN